MAGRNPQTIEEARAFVAHVESLFMPWNIDGLLDGFSEDCVVRIGDMPEFRGKAALEKLFRSRAERQIGYRLKKELRALAGDSIANYWEGGWRDALTGKEMAGRGSKSGSCATAKSPSGKPPSTSMRRENPARWD
jgi:nuclear transport factor 2 (NTF2) superfamily protein